MYKHKENKKTMNFQLEFKHIFIICYFEYFYFFYKTCGAYFFLPNISKKYYLDENSSIKKCKIKIFYIKKMII